MFGDGIGSLSVLMKYDSSPLSDSIWKKTGDQDNIWRLGRVNLDKTAIPDSFTIYFEGVKGKSDKGKFKYNYLFYYFILNNYFKYKQEILQLTMFILDKVHAVLNTFVILKKIYAGGLTLKTVLMTISIG